MNSSETERFEQAYRTIWELFNRSDAPDLSQHERQLLHHISHSEGVSLGWLASHLGLPKSTASVILKSLARRGFVRRRRDPKDERRLSIALTAKGRRRVEADTVLEPEALAATLAEMPGQSRRAMLKGMELLVQTGRSRVARRQA